MTRDLFIQNLTDNTIPMNPLGIVADEISPDEFEKIYPAFFEMIYEIVKTDVSKLSGYGEFNEKNEAEYESCESFIRNTFATDKEGYWYNWKEMFTTTPLNEEYFEKMLQNSLNYVSYCEGKRFLVNNNTFFCNLIVSKTQEVNCADWGRAGIMDYMMDFAIMDLNKPYLKVPEKLYTYAKQHDIYIPNFKERYLCMAFYKGLDTLRWHASIDDSESCHSIMRYLDELEDRIMRIGRD